VLLTLAAIQTVEYCAFNIADIQILKDLISRASGGSGKSPFVFPLTTTVYLQRTADTGGRGEEEEDILLEGGSFID